MTDGPHHTDKAEAARQARRARQAAALRENLRRRKAQARAVVGQHAAATSDDDAAPGRSLPEGDAGPKPR